MIPFIALGITILVCLFTRSNKVRFASVVFLAAVLLIGCSTQQKSQIEITCKSYEVTNRLAYGRDIITGFDNKNVGFIDVQASRDNKELPVQVRVETDLPDATTILIGKDCTLVVDDSVTRLAAY